MKRLPVYLSVVMLLGLLFPMVQQLTRVAYIPRLSGVTPADSVATDYSWWTRGLQKELEKQSTDSLSLQPACIRLRNQLEYSITGKINAQDIYSYNGQFYRMIYVNYKEEHEFVGYEKIEQHAQQLKALERRYGKPIYVIIAPTKLHYSRDDLPDFNKGNSAKTNYRAYKKAFRKAGVSVLDADGWFVREKRKHHRPPLMAKGGVHWTLYGGALAFDSLLTRCSADLKTDYQRVQMEFDPGDHIYPEDLDAVNLCNLLYPPQEKDLKLVHFPEVVNPKKRLYPVVISDSFFGVISWTPVHQQVLDDRTPYYYYFHTRFDRKNTDGKPFDDSQLNADLKAADCIIIICEVQNLSRFGFGFIEDQMEGK